MDTLSLLKRLRPVHTGELEPFQTYLELGVRTGGRFSCRKFFPVGRPDEHGDFRVVMLMRKGAVLGEISYTMNTVACG